jgi:hypothetical protein
MATLTTYQELVAVFTYLKLWIQDIIQHYYIWMILSLPKYMFGPPILHIQRYVDSSSEESDDDDNRDTYPSMNYYDVYISQLMFVFKPDEDGNIYHKDLHGAQLHPIVDTMGRFHIGNLLRFYPNLDLILLKYVKVQVGKKNYIPSENTKVITVDNKLDIYNHQSCKLGVAL